MKPMILALSVASLLMSREGRADTLADRFTRLSCAIVRIDYDGGNGTGFFIDGNGHIATAAHVAFEKNWSITNGVVSLSLVAHSHMQAVLSNGEKVPIPSPSPNPSENVAASNDIAVLATGTKHSCYLSAGDADNIRVGDHLIAIGYPASNPTGVLYDGFLSARHTHLPVPIGTANGQPIIANYEVLRVQMPITPGASGSPIIDDKDHAVGVVSEVPLVVYSDVQSIINAYIAGGGSGVRIGGFDLNPIVSHLAVMLTQFESPGSGYAIPLHQPHQ